MSEDQILLGLGHLLARSPSSEPHALACMRLRHELAAQHRFTLPLSRDAKGWVQLAGQPPDFTPDKDWTLVSLIESEAQPGVTADRTLAQTH